MSEEVVLRNITPRQQGVLKEIINKSEMFDLQKSGHIDVRGKEEIPDFPRYHGTFVCVGYMGNYHGKGISLILTNTNVEKLRFYHEQLKKVYEEIQGLGV